MIRKSMFEVQMEMLGKVLSKVLMLKNAKDYTQAQIEINVAGKQIVGMDISRMTTLADASLLAWFTSEGALDTTRCITAATLLREQADVARQTGDEPLAVHSCLKALRLLVESLIQEERLRSEKYRTQITELGTALAETELPLPLQARLFAYFEAVGEYAKAEDTLYTLKDGGMPDWTAEATAFYARLLALPDAALEQGGLPRDEVEAAQAEITA